MRFKSGFITGIVGLIGLACTSQAQKNPVYSSLESHVSGAEGVYVGTITDISGPSYDKDHEFGSVVSIETTETIKGARHKKFKVFLYDEVRTPPYKDWKQKQIACLWFMKNNLDPESPDKAWNALPVNPQDIASPLPVVGYFSIDFHLIRSPEKVLDTARKFAKENRGIAKTHSLTYIPELVTKLFPYRTGGEVIVPVVPELEQAALRMLQSPNTILPSQKELKNVDAIEYLKLRATDEGCLRRIGIQALAKFKSDRNVELIKHYLNDPFVEEYWERDSKVYSVRKVAYETLTKWGVQVEKPVLLAR